MLRWTTGGRVRHGVLAGLVCVLGLVPAAVAGQSQGDTEAVIIAAGRWAASQVPGASTRVDPHRTGRSTDAAVAGRIASALGAELGTLEQVRTCSDPMTPSSCRLSADRLLAISEPRVRDDEAQTRVYVWYRQDSTREPVARASWDVTLRRSADGWRVTGQRARP